MYSANPVATVIHKTKLKSTGTNKLESYKNFQINRMAKCQSLKKLYRYLRYQKNEKTVYKASRNQLLALPGSNKDLKMYTYISREQN